MSTNQSSSSGNSLYVHLLEYKDVLLLLASVALGVVSSIATTALQARYAQNQTLIEKQTSAAISMLRENQKVILALNSHYDRLKELSRELKEDAASGDVNVEKFANEWESSFEELSSKKQAWKLLLRESEFTMHLLFTPNEPLPLREDLMTSVPAKQVSEVQTKMRALRKALKKQMPQEEKLRIAILLADTAAPHIQEQEAEIRNLERGVSQNLQAYIRLIGK